MAQLDKDVALRIALAARSLPGVEVAQLLGVLHERFGPPLTLEKLGRVTVTDLKTGLGSVDGEEDGEDLSPGLSNLKNAVAILWGEPQEQGLPPTEEPLANREGVIRVAVASNNEEQLDGHFGSCLRFLVYDLSVTECRLVDVRTTISADLTDDKNAARAESVNDCQVLYVVSVGGPAAAKVIRQGIYPLKKPEGGEARELLSELQGIMAHSPPPWLAKILGVRAEERLARFASES